MRYEYKVLRAGQDYGGGCGEDSVEHTDRLEDVLNALDADGWEVVSSSGGQQSGEGYVSSVILRRPRKDEKAGG